MNTLFHCDLCQSQRPCRPYFVAQSTEPHLGKTLWQEIYQCTQCKLIFFPLEKTKDVHNLYSENYFQGGEYSDYLADSQIHEWNFKKRVKYLLGLCPSGKLFEIGSAYGFFLRLAQKHWEAKGIEISSDAVAFGQRQLGLSAETLQQGDLLKLHHLNSEVYDLVCLWDTLEHLDHPLQFITKAAELLKPGGHLVFTTLDSGSLLARFRGKNWRQIHPPTHLYYFDRKILKKYVEKAGLECTDMRSVGMVRSYRSMAHGVFAQKHTGQGLSEKSSTEWLYRLLTLGGRIDFPVYLNTGDLVQVTAKKL